jgi:large subunit ribosomal protein L18
MSRKVTKNTSEKLANLSRRKIRIRKKVAGTAERPRMCVTRSNRGLSVQLIDDDSGKTLLSARTPSGKSANRALAGDLGKEVATKANAAGIKTIVFDRGGNRYHGRIAAIAAAAREGGLQF